MELDFDSNSLKLIQRGPLLATTAEKKLVFSVKLRYFTPKHVELSSIEAPTSNSFFGSSLGKAQGESQVLSRGFEARGCDAALSGWSPFEFPYAGFGFWVKRVQQKH